MDNYKRNNIIRSILHKVSCLVLLSTALLCFFSSQNWEVLNGYLLFISLVIFACSASCPRCGKYSFEIDSTYFYSWEIPCRNCNSNDSETSEWQFEFIRYLFLYCWKLVLLTALIFMLYFAFMNICFPDIYWFYKLWTAGAFTGFGSFVIIFAFKHRLIRQNGSLFLLESHVKKFLWLGVVVMFVVFIYGLAAIPGFIKIERTLNIIRSLSPENISGISLKNIRLSPEEISRFAKSCASARLFYPSHEQSGNEFIVSIALKNSKDLDFPACIYVKHSGDIVLRYTTVFAQETILIPNTAELLSNEEKVKVKIPITGAGQ